MVGVGMAESVRQGRPREQRRVQRDRVIARSMRDPHAPSNQDPTGSVELAARVLLDGFSTYHNTFRDITRRARRRFETRDWPAAQSDAAERHALYKARVAATVDALTPILDDPRSATRWAAIKAVFGAMGADRVDAEIGETFFNSVARRMQG